MTYPSSFEESNKRNFKDLYDIVLGIGQAWGKMTDIQRAALGEALGGKRNARGLYAVFDNLDTLTGAYQTATNSAGSAAREQEHYAESVQYSIDQMKASAQELAYDFLSSDFLKELIDFGSKAIQFLDGIIDRFGSLKALLVGGGIADAIRGIFTGKGLFSSVVQTIANGGFSKGVGKGLLSSLLPKSDTVDALKKITGFGKNAGDVIAEGVKKSVESNGGAGEIVDDVTEGLVRGGAGEAAKSFGKKFLTGVGTFIKANPAIAIGGGVILGTAIAKGAYDAYKRKQIENANKATETYTQKRDEIDSYKSQYSDLYKQLNTEGISEEQRVEIRKQIIALQQQIVDQYGQEAAGVDLVNGKLDEQLGKLDSIASKQASDLMANKATRKAYKDAAEQMTKSRRYNLGTVDSDTGPGSLRNAIASIVNDIDGMTLTPDGTGLMTIRFEGDVTSAQAAIEKFSDRVAKIRNDFKDDNFAVDALEGITNAISSSQDSVTDTLGKYQENYLSGLEQAFHETFYGKKEDALLSKYEAAIKKRDEAIAIGDSSGFASAQTEAAGLLKELQGISEIDYSTGIKPLVEDINSASDMAGTLHENFKDLFDDNGVNKDNPYKDRINEIKEAVEEIKKENLDSADFADLTKEADKLGRKAPAIKKLGEIVADAMDLDLSDFSDYTVIMGHVESVLGSVGAMATVTSESLESSAQSFNQFRAGVIDDIANIDTLNGMLVESVSGKGLSFAIDESTGEIVGSMKTIKDAFEDVSGVSDIDVSSMFERTTNGIRINTEKWRELTAAKEEARRNDFIAQENQLLDEQARIREQIQQLNPSDFENTDAYQRELASLQEQLVKTNEDIESVKNLQSAWEGATSAYQKWIQAQSMGEEGDMFNNIRENALSRFDELTKQGLIGTNEYRGIAGLFTPESLDTATSSIDSIATAAEKGVERVRSYFTEDSSGIEKFAEDVQKLSEQFGPDKFGYVTETEDSYSFFGMDTQAIADNLGVSQDIVEAIFRRMQDYGVQTRFFDDDQVKQLRDIKKNADEAQEALRGMEDVEISFGKQKYKLSDAIDFDVATATQGELESHLGTLKAFEQQIDPKVNPQQLEYVQQLIGNIEQQLGILNHSRSTVSLSFEDVEAGQQAIDAVKERIEKIENTNANVDVKYQFDTSEDSQILEQIKYLQSFTSEELRGIFHIDVDDPSNVEELIEAIKNAPDTKTTNYEIGEVPQPDQDDLKANGLIDYSSYEITNKPTEQETTVESEIKFHYNQNLLNRLYKQAGIGKAPKAQKVTQETEKKTTETKTSSTVVSTSGASEAASKLADVASKLNAINGKGATISVTANTQKALDSINYIEKRSIDDKKFNVTANSQPALNTIGYIEKRTIGDKKFNITANSQPALNTIGYIEKRSIDNKSFDISVTGGALTSLINIKAQLDKIHSKTITITTKHTNEANGTAHAGGTAKSQHTPAPYSPARHNGSIGNSMINHYRWHAYAGGSWGLEQDEPDALINELGPEVVVRDGQWFILNNGDPTFANSPKSGLPGGLKKGDIIFNHRQTEDLFKHGYITGSHAKMVHADGTAHAEGTAFANAGLRKNASNQRSSTKKKKTSSSSKRNSSSSSSRKSSSSSTSKRSSSNSSKKSSSSSNTTKYSKNYTPKVKVISDSKSIEYLDWIEVKLDRIERSLKNVQTQADSTFVSFKSRATNTSKAISQTSNEIDKQRKAQQRYVKQANKIKFTSAELTEARKAFGSSAGKTSGLRKLIQEGKIDIDAISANVSGAQSRYDKAKEAYKTKKTRANAKKVDEAAKYLNTQKSRQQLKEKVDLYADWYNKALDARDAVVELREQEKELYRQRFDLKQTQYDAQIKGIEDQKSLIEAWIDANEARGRITTSNVYETLIAKENAAIEKLKEERVALRSALNNSMQKGKLTAGSEEWYSMRDAINECTQSIYDAQTAVAEYNQKIRELKWDHFDRLQEKIGDIATESEFLGKILEEHDMFNDKGVINKYGKAQLGLNAISYNTYLLQAQKYASQLTAIDKEIKNDKYNQTLLDRRQELLDAQRKAIENAYGERSAIKSLVEDGIKKQIEAIKDAISEYENLMDSQKDAYEYQRNIADKMDEINALRRQVSSWANDSSEEGAARRQRTQKSLQDAERDLADTQEDRRISQTKEMLSNLSDSYSNLLNARLDNIDTLINDVIAEVNSSKSVISSTIKSVASSIGYNLSSAMNTSVSGKKSIASTTKSNGDFQNKSTNVSSAVSSLTSSSTAQWNNAKTTGKTAAAKASTDASMTGWFNKRYYKNGAIQYGSNGKKSAGHITIKKDQYLVDKTGKILTGFQTYYDSSLKRNKKVYADKNGKILNKWQTINGKKYYFGARSEMLTGAQKIGKYVYFFDPKGVMQTGWVYEKKSRIYPKGKSRTGTRYYDPTTGRLLYPDKAGRRKIGGVTYNFRKDGSGFLNPNNDAGKKKEAWAKKKHAYKRGTPYVPDNDLYWTQEDGQEIIMRKSDGAMLTKLGRGDMVFTNEMTKALWDFAKSPEAYDRVKAIDVPDRTTNISVGDAHYEINFNLPNVQNSQELISTLQHSKKFEQIVQSMTVGRLRGKGAFAKYSTQL